MRDFIIANRETLKFIVNYHSYGNMFIIPYNGDNLSYKLTPEQIKLYDEIKNEAKFPSNMISGSAKTLLDYYANGEASDWALSSTGIIAMSPEIGSASAISLVFDIPSVREEA